MTPPRPESAPVAGSDDWQAVFRRADARVDVREGGFGEAPAEALGLARTGPASWACPGGPTRALVDSVLASGQPLDVVRGWDDPRCGPRQFHFTLSPLPAAPGTRAVDVVLVQARETTARRAQARALHLHAQLLDAMGEGVLLVEADDAIGLANPAAESLLGYDAGRLVGRTVRDLGDAFLAFVARPPQGRVGDGEAAAPLELVRRDGGTASVSATIRPVPGAAGRRLVVLRDVTERRRLERELLDTERRERERIARDLHDGVGQELTAVALLLKSIAVRVQKSDPATGTELDDVIALVNGVIGGTRTMARGLFEVALPASGLVGALDELVRRANEVPGPSVRLATNVAEPLQLDRRAVVELFRIAQEATTNARRHAEASCVDVTLESTRAAVRLAIEDDGRGLPEDAAARGGMGLAIMRYRAHVLGTELVVERRAGGGTRIACDVTRSRAIQHAETAPGD